MKKIGLVATVAMLVLAAILIISCSGAPNQAVVEAQTTPHAPQSTLQTVSASPATLQTSQPPATPAASAAPSSTPAPTSWPMATPAPTATLKPKGSPLTDDDYFIINLGGWETFEARDPYGVVDANGRVVVPFAFQSITEMRLTDREKPQKKYQYFFASQYMGVGDNYADSGCIYSTDGRQACADWFDWAVAYDDDHIAAERADNSLCGVMDADFKVVIPFKYSNIVCFDGWLAAMRKQGKSFWIDFYDKNCKLKSKVEVGSEDIFGANSEVLVATGTNGKIGFIDGSLTWCAKPQWDEYERPDPEENPLPAPGYVVTIDNKTYSVNKYGKQFVPKDCDPNMSSLAGEYLGHEIYEDNNAGILFNDEGKVLYRSNKNFTFTDGIILEDGKALDPNGKNLLPGVTDVLDWNPQTGYYECGTRAAAESYGWVDTITALYTKGGKKLPLPDGEEYQCVLPDRIIVKTRDGKYGICNSQGKWILAPQQYELNSSFWPCFLMQYEVNGEKDSKIGLMDDNGHILYNPVFDDINLLSKSRGLYEVSVNGVLGIIDTQGNWIWYNGQYNDLQD